MSYEHPLYRLKSENAALRSELDRLQRLSSILEQISALPEKLGDYIRRLETIADPVRDKAEIACLRENLEALLKLKWEIRRRIGTASLGKLGHRDRSPERYKSTTIRSYPIATIAAAMAWPSRCDKLSRAACDPRPAAFLFSEE